MILSKRERRALVAAIIVVMVFVVDRYIVSALFESRTRLNSQKQTLLNEQQQIANTMKRKRKLTPIWREMLAGGLDSSPSQIESKALHAIRDWSKESGLALSSVNPERSKHDGALREITFKAVGSGSMNAVARFLWHLETASFPVRMKGLQLNSRKEGTDSLSIQLRISTLYLAPETKGAPKANSRQTTEKKSDEAATL